MIRGLVVLIGLFLLVSCSKKVVTTNEAAIAKADNSYLANIDSLRKDRIKRLTAPQGWLSVVGLYWLEQGVNTIGGTPDNKVVFPRLDTETIGAYQLDGEEVLFGKVEGVEVSSNGQEYMGGPVIVEYPPTVANHKSYYWYILKRGDKYGIRLKDSLAAQRLNFKSIDYFATDKKYKVEAMVRKPATDEYIPITNVLGRTIDYRIAAYLDFELDGSSHSLVALDEGSDTFFVIFGDLTNSESSYGGGRFLYPLKNDYGKRTSLDFNLAENPPCAFTDFATCPLPPDGNKLPLKITAGEKIFGSH